MRIIGIGTDIVRVERIANMISKHPDTFLKKVFTENEIAYCQPRKASVQHFAGRWAAKEAILKAFGTGWAKGVQWTDIEVLNEMGGKPKVRLAGAARELCEKMGVVEVLISISHTTDNAVAFATATGHDE